MFLSCSMIMIFPWLLTSWLRLLKYLQAGIALGFLTSSLCLLSLMLNGVSDLLTIESCRYNILVDNKAAFTVDAMVDFKRFVGLTTLECCCYNKLLTAGRSCWTALDRLSCMVIIFSFYKFFRFMDGISANDLFQANAFYKGYNGKHTKGFFTTLICL